MNKQSLEYSWDKKLLSNRKEQKINIAAKWMGLRNYILLNSIFIKVQKRQLYSDIKVIHSCHEFKSKSQLIAKGHKDIFKVLEMFHVLTVVMAVV